MIVLEIGSRNSPSRNNERMRITDENLSFATGRPQKLRKRMYLYKKMDISWLIEYILSNGLWRMFELQNRLIPWFSLAGYLG